MTPEADGARRRHAGGQGRGRSEATTPRDWDAATYDRVADPMTRWGGAVLDRLPLGGDETVLDAGCGSGRVTEQLEIAFAGTVIHKPKSREPGRFTPPG